MTSLSDTLTVGLVLVLLFGSIALYLYTRIQQAEQKISLLESILLDLKMSSEIKSYTELPADEEHHSGGLSTHLNEHYIPYSDDEHNTSTDEDDVDANVSGNSSPSVSSKQDDTVESDVDQYKNIVAAAVDTVETVKEETLPSASRVETNYEAMTIKELQTLAKSRGISGAGSMKKVSIIEALKTSDRSSNVEPGSSSLGTVGTFLETSGSFLETESE